MERSKVFAWNSHSVTRTGTLGISARTADTFYLVHLSCPVPGLSRCPSYLLPSCSRFPTLILRSLPLFLGVYEVYSQSPWWLPARLQSELMPEWRQSPWRTAGGKPCPPGWRGLGALGCFPGSSCGSNLNPLSPNVSALGNRASPCQCPMAQLLG